MSDDVSLPKLAKFVATNNRLKYKKLNICTTKLQKMMSLNASLSHSIQMHQFYINYYNQIMNTSEKDEHRKRRDQHKAQQSQSGSSEEQEEDDNDNYESDFIVDDEDQSEGYQVAYRRGYSDDEQKEKKSKKHKKKQKKKKKEKKRKEQEESYDEDDLDLIDNDQKLTRLKKKKEPRRESDEDEDPDIYGMEENDVASGEQGQSDDDVGYNMEPDESDSFSEIQEVIHHQKDIFDPADMRKLTIEDEDRDLAQIDLPERYIGQLKTYTKNFKKNFVEVKQMLEIEEKIQEAQWIYYKIRAIGLLESYDERECKQRIRKVLDCFHKEHLDIMYVFYYRKKILVDFINLEVLWKIQEFDEEWYTFREKQKKCIDFLEILLPSYTEVPKQLIDFAYQCPEQKTLKYFEDFSVFAEAKWMIKSDGPQNEKRNAKRMSRLAFITQIAQKGVAHELEYSSIFLSPQNLCYNLKARNQERKPRTPQTEPKDQFERLIRSTDNGREDRAKYNLLTPENRFKNITKYLCYQLFTYPQLRRILKEKYYKKLIISTQPTKKGIQDIDLYSIYFPVKRIKDKPVSTLKREVWILSQKAKKLDLITIELRFEWQLPNADKTERESKERDTVYMELARSYFDISNNKSLQIWNIFRKRILHGLLNQHFLPHFMNEVKEDLTRDGQRQIINACCQRLRLQLNKGPSLKEGKPIKILSLVLEDTKLGVAFVDESGKAQFTFHTVISNDDQLRRFVGDENLSIYIKEYKPDMILIAANCKRAQTLRKELRDPKLFPQSIFCAFGEYEIPRLIAKKQIIKGLVEEEAVLEAISMARLKKNPMSQIISLWSDKINDNGILSMNLHQYQNFVDQRKLKENLEKVIIEVVNMVGLDINEINKNEHLQTQLEFISGLGPKKAFVLLDKLKDSNEIYSRASIATSLNCEIVSKNCSPFLKIETSFHKALFEKLEKDKKTPAVKEYEHVNLLDMTRIPEEWYPYIMRRMGENKTATVTSTFTQMRNNKKFSKLTDENITLLDIFKNPEKVRGIDLKFKENLNFDDEVVKSQIISRFRNPRDPQRVMQNRQIFFNLLRETPETLKRYMIMQVKVLSMKKNYLNVIIPQNGLFGYIKLQGKTPEELEKYEKLYQKGTTIKAVIIGFPFDEKTFRDQPSEEQELLKIQMALDFPHKDNDRHDGSRHDCMSLCFPAIVKEIHPLIDLEKDRFDLRKEDRPIIEVKEDKIIPKNLKADLRRISHPKYKNIGAIPAIEMIKDPQIHIGDFIIRPSSQGPEYLTITWKFFKGVIVHIKVKCQHRGMNSMNMTYRIEDRDNRSYNSLEQIIDKCIRPMNVLVQDITSNKKFIDQPIQYIENLTKRETKQDSSHIFYYFGVSEDYPQFILLIYMFKDAKPNRELIKVRSSGFYFHDQQFSSTRDLIAWFKEHLKEKEYQKYVKMANQNMQRR